MLLLLSFFPLLSKPGHGRGSRRPGVHAVFLNYINENDATTTTTTTTATTTNNNNNHNNDNIDNDNDDNDITHDDINKSFLQTRSWPRLFSPRNARWSATWGSRTPDPISVSINTITSMTIITTITITTLLLLLLLLLLPLLLEHDAGEADGPTLTQ